MTCYYHGGPSGIHGWILPPDQTGANSLAGYVRDEDFCDTSKVYVATSLEGALMYAFLPGYVIYEVEPVGDLTPDPDCFEPGLSFMCEKARIVRRIRVSSKTRKLAKRILFSDPPQPHQ